MTLFPFPFSDPDSISLQRHTILSPTTLCTPIFLLTHAPKGIVSDLALTLTDRVPGLGFATGSRASPTSWPNRVQHCFVYGRSFAYVALHSTPPLATQLPFSYGQAMFPSGRGERTPVCWCVLSGAHTRPSCLATITRSLRTKAIQVPNLDE